MMIRLVVPLVALVVACSHQLAAQQPALEVVPEVDYQRYAGKWFEIARLPNRFEEDCVANVTAEYTPRPDGRITVVNRCDEAGNKINVATGIARREEGRPAAVLEVRFAPSFLSFLPMVWGDYRIIALPSDYRYAVVGSDDREYLWVLSRTPQLDDSSYEAAVGEAKRQGFDVGRLIRTKQS